MVRRERSIGQGRTMERRHIDQMLRNIDEYDLVKSKKHSAYRMAEEFYTAKGLCKQNFLKYYRRYVNAGREIGALIPHKTGRKFRDIIKYEDVVSEGIKDLREKAYNRYDIARLVKVY